MSTCTDAVANMTMARQGFPRMAIGACYGGPLLSILYIHNHYSPNVWIVIIAWSLGASQFLNLPQIC